MKTVLLLLISFCSFSIYSQEEKENKLPVIFGELLVGGAGTINGDGGILIGGELNYQHKKSLFSARYVENLQLETDVFLMTPVTAYPVLRRKNRHQEKALLYGRRWIYGGSSLSVSGGFSWNQFTSKLTDENNRNYQVTENYPGFPIEVNFKWFNSEKERYRIFYGLIPVGEPTAFGESFGFKLVGNISRNSFVGLGLVFGTGIHKKYK